MIILFLIIFILIFHYRNAVCKQIFDICNDYAYSYSAESVNQAVLLTLKDCKYEDIVKITKNSQGDIVLMSTDSIKINSINRNISNNAMLLTNDKFNKGIKIPLFAFLGIPLLSGYGNEVDFKALTVTSAICKFRSEFRDCGINQTLHSIYIDVENEVITEIPFNRRKSTCTTEVLLTEAVLIGKVPEIYIKGGLFDR